MIKSSILRQGIILDYPGGLNVIPSILEGGKRVKVRKKDVMSEAEVRESFEDAILLTAKVKGATSLGMQQPLETGNGKETDFPLEPAEGRQLANTLILGLLTSKLQDNTFELFQTTTFMVNYYSYNRR